MKKLSVIFFYLLIQNLLHAGGWSDLVHAAESRESLTGDEEFGIVIINDGYPDIKKTTFADIVSAIMSTDVVLFSGGEIGVGVDDTIRGTINIFGSNTIQGGAINIYNAAVADGLVNRYSIRAYGNTLQFLVDGNQGMSLDYNYQLLVSGNISAGGNITVGGTVDGRDVATDGGILDSHVADTANPHSVTASQVGINDLDDIPDGTTYSRITDTDLTDLTDSGETSLHIHDNRYYTETEVDNELAALAHNDLTGLQGGSGGEYYHFDTADYTDVQTLIGGSLLGDTDAEGYAIYNHTTKIATVTGTTHEFDPEYSGYTYNFTSASAVTVTCPNDLTAGWYCTCYQLGAGTVTFTAESGGSLNNTEGNDSTNGTDAPVSLYVATNTGTDAYWVLGGNTQ